MEYTNKTTKTSQENCTPCNRRSISYHMMKYTNVTRKTVTGGIPPVTKG